MSRLIMDPDRTVRLIDDQGHTTQAVRWDDAGRQTILDPEQYDPEPVPATAVEGAVVLGLTVLAALVLPFAVAVILLLVVFP